MKQRIIEYLIILSKPSRIKEQKSLANELQKELQISTEILHKRAANTLKAILHNYAFFDISTIDKFNHRLIKTFAKDLKIPQNFEVILDKDILLKEAIDKLIGNARENEQLTNILVDFALEKIDDEKSWNIEFDLTKVGELLFNENHTPYLTELKDKDLNTFLDLQKSLQAEITSQKKSLVSLATETLTLIDEAGLIRTDFKSGYFPDFMEKVKEDPATINFDAGWKQDIDAFTFYNKSTLEDAKATIDSLIPQFISHFNHIKQGFGRLMFLRNVYQNTVPLTLLNALQKEIDALLLERDQLHISKFNALITEQIKDQPAPFIYERLGEKYRHYFIDEFQDTSQMQWSNLVPLIEHALQSEDLQGTRGSLFLVGDAKQAIYRWRGGRSEQFLKLMESKDHPFGMAPAMETLATNYRSYKEVVDFNNSFFTALVPFLQNERNQELFLKGNKQNHTAVQGGQVSLRFLDADAENKEDLHCDTVIKVITELLASSVSYGEICVLYRNNSQGAKIAAHLLKQQIPVISSESLLLKQSPAVLFLINLLKWVRNSSDRNIAYEILTFLSPTTNRHQFYTSYLDSLSEHLFEDYNFDLAFFTRNSVYDSLEYAIKRFKLCDVSNAYVSSFLDEVLTIEQTLDSGITTFLTYWEKKQGSLSIPAPENINAVRLMTIHKSKGLEFPFVIYPFATTDIYSKNDSKIWIPAADQALSGFKNILLNHKKEMMLYHEEAKDRYDEEQEKKELDTFNLLYVALTRSIQGLYVITEKKLNSKKVNSISDLFIHYLKEIDRWDESAMQYDFGKLVIEPKTKVDLVEEEKMSFIYSHKFDGGLQISTRAGELWGTSREVALSRGNLLHYGLSFINTLADVEPTVTQLLATGIISAEEQQSYLDRYTSIVTHPDLLPYFTEGIIIKNEKSIITENGVILRPDRMVFQDKEVTILDYKTGKEQSSHLEQLDTYANAMTAMGFVVANKILVYIENEIRTLFI